MERIITDIQVQKKHPSRRSIFLDGNFFCGVGEDVLVKLQLKKGMEIDDKELKKLLYEEELSKAKNYTYRILGRRMYTTKEIRDKLQERGYVDDIVVEVISTLERYGYLDDKLYAEEWIQSRMRSKPKGKIVIRQELTRKGVDKNIIEESLNEAFDESWETDMAMELARSKVKSYAKDDLFAAKRKLYSFLLRRGFNYDTVKQVVDQVLEDGNVEEL
ncbi:hypothetical protein GF312_17565 [Candidatus Poribacteria bacterium]|nr:hypothetical protein [Candidatus Poribacteria bacterium]